MEALQGVILDRDSLHPDDLNLQPLMDIAAVNWRSYANTTPDQTAQRIAHANIVLTNKVVLGASEINAASQLKDIGVLATGTNIIDHSTTNKKHRVWLSQNF